MPEHNAVMPWQGPGGVAIPVGAQEPGAILPYAVALAPAEKTNVVQALNAGLYDMSAEYVWKRSMARLRSTLSWLGMKFIGEMLGRDDVAESSSPEAVLTDYDTIRLAEALGVVNSTGALRLRHGFELMSHFSRNNEEGTLHSVEAMVIIVACVQYVLGEQNIGVAVDFTTIRDRLLSEVLKKEDPQVEQLITSPPFFLSTTLRVLLSAVKHDHGARLQHALANLNTLLPLIWGGLTEQDRWSVGEAYAEATAAGNTSAILDLKRALLKVRGFDYVPENLRSNTYRRAAQAVMDAHFSWNNYYLEGSPTSELARLGSVIPKPAVGECIRAYLCVFMGNQYGYSFDAAPTAAAELKRVTHGSWQYYLDKILKDDDVILEKLVHDKPILRFGELLKALDLQDMDSYDRAIRSLIEAAMAKKVERVRASASALLTKLKGDSRVAA
jgi:hypothetical protein